MTKTIASKSVSAAPIKAVAPKSSATVLAKAPAAEKPLGTAAPKADGASGDAKTIKKASKAPVKSKPAPEIKEKVKKPKLVRDSFTMPEAEYAVLGEVKKACLKAGFEVKKSELLRVGVALIRELSTERLKEVLDSLPTLKAGRPKKAKA